MKLFDRRAILTVGTIQINGGVLQGRLLGVKFDFHVTKTIDGKPNKAEIHITNMNPSHRAALEGAASIPVQLEAGYAEGTSVLFLGTLRSATSVKDGPDWVTTIGSGDGEKAVQTARINVSIAPGTNTDEVFRKLAKALGVGEGNLAQAAQTIRSAFSGTGNIFTAGTVLTGQASAEMNRICRSLDLEWSIQNGKLQILERTKALAGKAILLSGLGIGTGMIGSPSISVDSKDQRQVLSAEMAMIPDVYPGRIMIVESIDKSGQFRIESSEHQGDTHGPKWGITVKAKRY